MSFKQSKTAKSRRTVLLPHPHADVVASREAALQRAMAGGE
jgi:hypothetical protein